MDCCYKSENEKQPNNDFKCPNCKNIGAKVSQVTPQSLLKNSSKKKLNKNLIYKFCVNPDCEIVYFSNNDKNFFMKDELKVKTTIKDNGLDVSVCYCFSHTRQSVLDEIIQTGYSTVVEDIKLKMKDPGCFCETSNPQGACCLANNIAWVKQAKELIAK